MFLHAFDGVCRWTCSDSRDDQLASSEGELGISQEQDALSHRDQSVRSLRCSVDLRSISRSKRYQQGRSNWILHTDRHILFFSGV